MMQMRRCYLNTSKRALMIWAPQALTNSYQQSIFKVRPSRKFFNSLLMMIFLQTITFESSMIFKQTFKLNSLTWQLSFNLHLHPQAGTSANALQDTEAASRS